MRILFISLFFCNVSLASLGQNKLIENILFQDRLADELKYFIYQVESKQLWVPAISENSINRFVYFMHISNWKPASNNYEYSFGYVLKSHAFDNVKNCSSKIYLDGYVIYVSLDTQVDKDELYIEDCIFDSLSTREFNDLKERHSKIFSSIYDGSNLIFHVKESNDQKIISRYRNLVLLPPLILRKTFFKDSYINLILEDGQVPE